MARRKALGSPYETYVDTKGDPVKQPVSPQAFDQARGLADDNLTAEQFREGPDIADERKAENKAARKLAKGEPAPYPETLVTPHGR